MMDGVIVLSKSRVCYAGAREGAVPFLEGLGVGLCGFMNGDTPILTFFRKY
jgi:hypothetical protein